jgi:hypothetical protein
MSASFRKIDYSLRPAKHAERRMLSEIFRRLRPFQPVEEYAYIGLGSVWFADFALFHRALGIRDMQSIERASGAKARIEANKPFAAINVHYQESSVVLPTLDWSKRSFVWLDYDEPLSLGMLLDLKTVASRAISGSVLAVSVQCHHAAEIAQAAEEPEGPNAFTRFRENFGRELVPSKASEEDLSGWPFGALSRTMIAAQIEAALAVRNLGVSAGNVVRFIPICDINYEDGAKMTTTVGILAEERDHASVANCGFDRLDFMPSSGRLIKIKVPILTNREIRHLERQLPKAGALQCGEIPSSEADCFAELYRYLPNFAVLEN